MQHPFLIETTAVPYGWCIIIAGLKSLMSYTLLIPYHKNNNNHSTYNSAGILFKGLRVEHHSGIV